MNVLSAIAPLLGRILLASLFLWSGYGKIGGFEHTLGYMTSKGVPLANIALIVTIVVELGASVLLVIGWRARLAALVLFVWMIPVTIIFHNFWTLAADAKVMQMVMFYKNLAIMGGLLMVVGMGPGAMSIKKD
ncbi:MAG: DoxX family protein [Gammaproteobacteria bacterium]|nr:DoxX family protein [Gammaproteobacteria bacterium]